MINKKEFEEFKLGSLWNLLSDFSYFDSMKNSGVENMQFFDCGDKDHKLNKSTIFMLLETKEKDDLFWFVFLGPSGKKFYVPFSYICLENFNKIFSEI